MITEKQTNVVIVGGVVVVGVIAFMFAKEILEFLGLKDDKEDKAEKAKEAAEKKNFEDALKDKTEVLIKQGGKPSYTAATYLEAATIIHENTKAGYIKDNDKVAIDALLRYTPKQIDFDMISKAYGLKPYYNILGYKLGERGLMQTLSKELTGSEKNRINEIFKKRGLKTKLS